MSFLGKKEPTQVSFSLFYGNPDTLRFIFAEKHKSNEKHKKD